jgi:hypothetical protein
MAPQDARTTQELVTPIQNLVEAFRHLRTQDNDVTALPADRAPIPAHVNFVPYN